MKLPVFLLFIMALLPASALRAASDPFTDQAPFPLGSLSAMAQMTQGSSALKVTAITTGGPAATAGLRVNDFIYGVNGERLSQPGNPHDVGWRGPGSELGYAIERSESSNGALSLMVLRPGTGPITVNATLPAAAAWLPSFPVGDVRMGTYYEKVCADIHGKIQDAAFFSAVTQTSPGDASDYCGAFYGFILLAHSEWNSTSGSRPFRNSINKLRDRAIAFLNTRVLEPVQPAAAGYVDAGWDNWCLTAWAMFLGEYRRKSGDTTVNADVQRTAVLIANRIQDTRGNIMAHGGVSLGYAYPAATGLNIINAKAMLAMGILKGAGANFSAMAGTSGLTIDQKFARNWTRLKGSTNIYNGADEESKNEDGNLGYNFGMASGRVSDGAGGGWDSNARTPCAAAGYQIYLAAGGTPATADDTDKLNRMKAYTPRNWQRQHNNHGYSAPGTAFSQMLLPFLTDRQQSYFRENSRFLFTLSRDHTGAVQYFPGRANIAGDSASYLRQENVRYINPGMASAVASGNLPSFPLPAGATSRVFVRMNAPRNDWPKMEARRVRVTGLSHALDLDVTNYQGNVLTSGYTAAWTKVSGAGVNFSSPSTVDTTVTFAASGYYRLQLHVTAGAYSLTELYDFEVANAVTPPNDTATITRQPLSRICGPGQSAFFSVGLAGNGPFVYQWKLNGVAYGGPGTSPVLSVPNPGEGHFGTYQCTITYPGGLITTNPAMLCPAGTFSVVPGGLKREVWNGLGSSMATLTASPRYPLSPDTTGTVTAAEAPSDQGENYGQRLRGWVIPSTTGSYRFFIAADNAAELWLSTDATAANKTMIAQVNTSTYREYSAGPSTAVNLAAGRRYYIEALHVEGGFDDFLSIAWQKPGDAVPADGSAPIPGAFLESTQYIPAPGSDGLLSHWRLDEGSGALAADSQAAGNEASITGATWTTGKSGGALHFDGVDDRVFCDPSASLGGLMAFTASAWVKLDSPAAAGVIIQQRPTDGLPPQFSESGQYQLSVTTAGTVKFLCSGHSSIEFNITGYKNLNDGQWHHITAVRELSGDGRIYVDGVLDGKAGSNGFIWPLDPENSVGIGADVSVGAGYFKGSIDDVRIYNTALTQAQARALAQVGITFTRGWSSAPWTNDATAGISTASSWAWHFGEATTTTIQGQTVSGTAAMAPAVAGQFSITGTTALNNTDTNTLTALTGTGSAVAGKSFIWGGNPATVTLQGLVPGHNYVVTLLSCGWEAAGGRRVAFSSGADALTIDQDQYGDNNGIRITYGFLADAPTRVITATPVVPANTFHFYGLALRDDGTEDATRSAAPWTDDTTAGIIPGISWAYHFGSATAATVAGQTVPGVAGANPSVAGKFAITGANQQFNNDDNMLTAAGGTGSAALAANFIWGGNPATITLQGLVSGRNYVATFLSVGWEAAGSRKVTFTSGSDRFVVDQGQYGNNNGIRVDYPFTADAATRVITIAPVAATPTYTLHLYGLALRQGFIVTNECDFGPGSLRQALTDATLTPGPNTLTFDPALSGKIMMTGSDLPFGDGVSARSLTMDATGLPGGLTLSGRGSNRIFRVTVGATLGLKRLNLIDGRAAGAFPASYGGGILAQGTVNLSECSISGCSASTAGGAIAALNGIEVTLDRCAVYNNSAGYGGAVQNEASLIALTSTFANNMATQAGGAISAPFNSSVLLKHCTVSGNSAAVSGGGLEGTGFLIENIIAAGNTGPVAPNINGTPIAAGVNITSGNPFLTALGHYGGPTPTMLPMPGSPAINGAPGSAATTDQRGYPRGGNPDIGAAEHLGGIDLNRYWDLDWDGDGNLNGAELALGTDPSLSDPGSSKNLGIVRQPNGQNVLTFGYNSAVAAKARWVLTSTTDLTTWSRVFTYDGAPAFFGDTSGGFSGSTFTITTAQPGTRAFYRFEAELIP